MKHRTILTITIEVDGPVPEFIAECVRISAVLDLMARSKSEVIASIYDVTPGTAK